VKLYVQAFRSSYFEDMWTPKTAFWSAKWDPLSPRFSTDIRS